MSDGNVLAQAPAPAVAPAAEYTPPVSIPPEAPDGGPVDIDALAKGPPPPKDEPKAEEAKADEPKPDAEAEPEGDESEDEPEAKRKREPGSVKQKRKTQALQAELADAHARIRELQSSKPDANDPEPKADQFPGDYLAYDRAYNSWNIRQSIRTETAKALQADKLATARAIQNELHQERVEAYEANAELVRTRLPEFDSVIKAAKAVEISLELQTAILASDKPALLAFYLATKPDVIRQFNGMSEVELAREIGRLEGRVHLPKPKIATEAPKPLSTPAGGAAPIFDPEKAPMAEYIKWRKATKTDD